MQRIRISPPLNRTFDQVYEAIGHQPSSQTPTLATTGGVRFTAGARTARDGRPFIALPHGNRIYEGDWGFTTHAMGQTGQRIGHYSVPLARWAADS
jgi:hypothetical protein